MKKAGLDNLRQSALWRNVMIRTLALVVIPVLALTIYFSCRNETNVSTTVRTQNEALATQAFDAVDTYLGQLQEQVISICNDSVLFSFLTRGYLMKSDYHYYTNTMGNRFAYAVNALDGATIRIYMTNLTIPMGFGIFYEAEALLEEPLLADFVADPEQADCWLLLPQNYLSDFNVMHRQQDCLMYIRKMADYNGKPVGYIAGSVPIPRLVANSGLSVHNVHNLNDRTLTLYYTSEYPYLQLSEKQLLQGHGTCSNMDYIAITMNAAGLRMIVCVPSYQHNPSILLLPLSLAGIAIFLLVMFTLHISQIIQSIQQLINQVRHSLGSDMQFRLSMTGNQDMDIIVKSMNTLLEQIAELMDKNVKQQLMIHQAQLLALQHQINPHFIYNTVDLIAARIELQGMYEESDALSNFAALFRYNLNVNNEKTTLMMELANVRQYLNIQKLSKPNIILHTDIAQGLEYLEIPRFTFQPLVENSVLHGLTDPEETLTITISANLDGSDALFSITDDGVGMPQATLEKLRSRLNDPNDKDRSSIGLINIHRRLLLLNGSGLQIESQEGEYTIIRFRLPV